MTLQELLDLACRQWGVRPPWRMPLPVIYTAAQLCEWYSRVTGSHSPLTRDFIAIGRVPYFGDTARMRAELLPSLRFRTIYDGIATL